MARKKIIITAGATREAIDPVRFISNASSGKMGYALARAAQAAGYDVTLITASTTVREPKDVKIERVVSAEQMFEAVKKFFPTCDCLIMAAAVSDYTPAKVSKTKIKKSTDRLVIELKPTTDILKWAGRKKDASQYLVGFALEDVDLKGRAEKKMRDKNLDMIIANSPEAIGADRSTVHIKQSGSDWQKLTYAKKTATAKKIISLVQKQL